MVADVHLWFQFARYAVISRLQKSVLKVCWIRKYAGICLFFAIFINHPVQVFINVSICKLCVPEFLHDFRLFTILRAV